MHQNVKEMMALLPPPEWPSYNKGNWSEVEAELGTALPQDFKDFTEAYGSVSICGTFWLHTPFFFVGANSYTPLTGEKEAYRPLLLGRLREMDAVVDGRANVPFPDFPTPGGLLPIGTTDGGDLICWITRGIPDEWGVFYWSFPGINTFTFKETNLTGFMLNLLRLDSPLFPEAMPEEMFDPDNRRVDATYCDETGLDSA